MICRLFDVLRHWARSRRWTPSHAQGRRGEDLAHRLLQRKGMTVVARNWQTRSRTAEADLIAWDGPTLVFVEVKTRASADFGTPDQAVDAEKRQKILRAAGDYIRRADLNWDVVRFDIVSVLTGNHPQVIHLTDAFGRRTSL